MSATLDEEIFQVLKSRISESDATKRNKAKCPLHRIWEKNLKETPVKQLKPSVHIIKCHFFARIAKFLNEKCR